MSLFYIGMIETTVIEGIEYQAWSPSCPAKMEGGAPIVFIKKDFATTLPQGQVRFAMGSLWKLLLPFPTLQVT
jgi:hypothetical protein